MYTEPLVTISLEEYNALKKSESESSLFNMIRAALATQPKDNEAVCEIIQPILDKQALTISNDYGVGVNFKLLVTQKK